MAIQNNNRKFLDQAGIVKLVQGLNAKYAAMYAVKGSEQASGVAYSNTTMGASVTDVKGALDVLVDNVVRQNGETVSLSGNMKAVEAKIDAEVLRAQGEEKKNADAIAVINELLGQGQTGDAGSIADRLAALETFHTSHDHKPMEEAIAKLDGAVDVEGSVKKQIKDAMDAHVLAQKEIDDAQDVEIAKKQDAAQYAIDKAALEAEDARIAGLVATEQGRAEEVEGALSDRIEALEDLVGEEKVEDAVAGVQDALDDYKEEVEGIVDGLEEAIGGKVSQDDYDEVVEDFEGRIAANEVFVEAQPAIDKAQNDRLDALEGLFKGEESVENKIAAAEEAAKGYADEKVEAAVEAQGKVDAAQDAKIKALEDDAPVKQAAIEAAQAAADAVQAEMNAFKAAAEVGDAAVDTLKEIQSYITSDLAAADQMVKDIAAAQKAADDAQAAVDAVEEQLDKEGGLVDRLEAVEEFVGGHSDVERDARIKALEDANKDGGAVKEAIDAVADDLAEALEAQAEKDGAQDDAIQAVVDALADEKDAAKEGSLAKKIADEAEAREDADDALAARIAVFEKDGAQDVAAKEVRLAALEAKFEGDNSVDKKIAAAQAAAEAKAAELDAALQETLQGKIDEKVAQSAYDEKVAELVKADTDNLAEAKKHTNDAIAQEVIDRNAAIKVEEDRAKLAEKANADAIAAIKDGETIDSFADVEAAFAQFGFLSDDEIAAAITEAFGE